MKKPPQSMLRFYIQQKRQTFFFFKEDYHRV